MYLIQLSNVYKQTELFVSNDTCQCAPLKGIIGPLPKLFNGDGSFNHEANSYLFNQKAIKAAKDLTPYAQALQAYYQFLEDKGEYVQPEIQAVRGKLKEQKRIKNNCKDKYGAEREKLALFAAAQHHLNDKLVKAMARIDELEYQNAELRERLAKLKRSKVVPIK